MSEERVWIDFENQGKKLFGVMHRPKTTEGKRPAVLMCHGFGGTKVGRYRMYVELAQILSENGIVALRFDFRGSGDSEGEMEDVTLEGEVSDALKALEVLSQDPQVDSQRIGILGKSFGGLVSVLVAKRSHLPKCIALWSPAFSYVQWESRFREVQNPHLSHEKRVELLQFDGFPISILLLKQFYELRLEKELEDLNEIPILHIHGEKDQVVNITHADQYRQSRQEATAETIIVRLPNTDHDYSHSLERKHAVDLTAHFFTRILS